jgi:NUMOD3 motif-containing protein
VCYPGFKHSEEAKALMSAAHKRVAKRLPLGRASRNQLLLDYKNKAEERGLFWNLSDEAFDLLTQGSCRYCGVGPQSFSGSKHNNGLYNYNGIDRIDNKRGYVLGNVASCCKLCNHMKWMLGEQEFLAHIMRITMRSLPEFFAFEKIGIVREESNVARRTDDVRPCR